MTDQSPVVLVVDDEVQIRRFLRAGLELDGFIVQDAETGAEALRWATLKPPSLVILDLGLPDMDGSEVLERLRTWSNVPLIVLSVRSNEAEKVRLLEMGADDYVVKPFGMAELLARTLPIRPLEAHGGGTFTELVGPGQGRQANRDIVELVVQERDPATTSAAEIGHGDAPVRVDDPIETQPRPDMWFPVEEVEVSVRPLCKQEQQGRSGGHRRNRSS